MELEKQVCPLDLAKRLKELGVKQESLYAYILSEYGFIDGQKYENKYMLTFHEISNSPHKYCAFTVAELGEMLPAVLWPDDINGELVRLDFMKGKNDRWLIVYYTKEDKPPYLCLIADTEANARAKMLIELIEKKLYEPTK